jgi:hypothetical protein
MSQRVSGRPLAPEGRILSQVSQCDFVVGKVALGENFLRVLRFSPIIITLPLFHVHIRLNIAVIRGQTCEAWKLSKYQRPFGNKGHLDGKVLQMFYCLFD